VGAGSGGPSISAWASGKDIAYSSVTGKRWVPWRIPEGNSNHLNVANQNGSRQGYKDNRAEYFCGAGAWSRACR
jgi:hypothetical protein